MRLIIILLLLVFTSLFSFSQNPFKQETKVVSITTEYKVKNQYSGEKERLLVTSVDGALAGIDSRDNYLEDALRKVNQELNTQGFGFKSIVSRASNTNTVFILFYEKADSYKEHELHKLINELTARIDNSSKRFTDSAMSVMQVNILNYLKAIPADVISSAYKQSLTSQILSEAEDKIKKVAEELKKEIRSMPAK